MNETITKTEARRQYGRAVARLRSTGTKVSAIIGHDRDAGEIRLGITLPSYADHHLIQKPTVGPFGYARLTSGPQTGDSRIFITTPRVPHHGDVTGRKRLYALHLIDAARLLHEIATFVDTYPEA